MTARNFNLIRSDRADVADESSDKKPFAKTTQVSPKNENNDNHEPTTIMSLRTVSTSLSRTLRTLPTWRQGARATTTLFQQQSATTTRSFTTSFSAARSYDDDDSRPSNPFTAGPAPPRLPTEEQAIFDDLLRRSTGAFSTPRVSQAEEESGAEERHPDAPVGVKPEFEGDTNPRTGEVGGPKNEPLRWGSGGDWSYSGRVTDF